MATRADVRRLAGSRLRTTASVIAGQSRRLSRRDVEILGRTDLLPQLSVPEARPVTEDEALGMPPFGRAVELLANAIAGTDWYARRVDRQAGLWERLEDQPSIITNPYPLQTVWNYKWAVAEDGILYGNHFALLGDPDWRTGRPGFVVPIAADEVWLLTDPRNPGWWNWVIGGETFSPDDLLHISFGARSGQILGRGVLQQYADWLRGPVDAEQYSRDTFDAEQYSRDTFAAGALPPAVILTNQAATPAQASDLKDRWRELMSTREPIILPNGTDLKPVVGNAEQAQLVQARTWNAQQSANAVGVPGWKLGLDGPTMTYQNVETGDIDFVRDSVDRYGRPITESVSKWLLPAGTELVWDYASRMRADQSTQADVLIGYKEAGIVTVDEARAAINRRPLGYQEPTGDPEPPNTTGNEDAAAALSEAAGVIPQIGA